MNVKLRRLRRWARYANHYAHIGEVAIIGRGGVNAIAYGGDAYHQIRKQAKHPREIVDLTR